MQGVVQSVPHVALLAMESPGTLGGEVSNAETQY